MKAKGICFSLEAIFSLLILCAILLMPIEYSESYFNEVLVVQKHYDLFSVWENTKNLDTAEMAGDVEFVLGGVCNSLKLGGTEVMRCENENAAKTVVSEASIFVNGIWHEIKLTSSY